MGGLWDDAKTLSAGTAENLFQPLHVICKCYYEEPCAEKPHAWFWCATKGTKVMEEGPSVGAKQVDPPNSPMLLRSKAMVVNN